MSHDHAGHSHAAPATEGRLALAVLVNVGLTVVQVVGGILSGSLAHPAWPPALVASRAPPALPSHHRYAAPPPALARASN